MKSESIEKKIETLKTNMRAKIEEIGKDKFCELYQYDQADVHRFLNQKTKWSIEKIIKISKLMGM